MLLLPTFLYQLCFYAKLYLLAVESYSVTAPLLMVVCIFSSMASTATKLRRTPPYLASMMKVLWTRKIGVDKDLLTSHKITIICLEVDVSVIANPIPTIILQSLSNCKVCADERIYVLPCFWNRWMKYLLWWSHLRFAYQR